MCLGEFFLVGAQRHEERGEVLRQAASGHVESVREALIDVLEPDELAVLAKALGRVGRRLR